MNAELANRNVLFDVIRAGIVLREKQDCKVVDNLGIFV